MWKNEKSSTCSLKTHRNVHNVTKKSIQFNLDTWTVCRFPPQLNLYQLTEKKGMIGTQGWMDQQVLILPAQLCFAKAERENWICGRLKPSHAREDTDTRLPLSSPPKLSTLLCPFCRPDLVWLSLWSRMAVAPSATFPPSVILPLLLPS